MRAMLDLSKKATFDAMVPLDLRERDENGTPVDGFAEGETERPGSEPTSSATKLSNRDGYVPGFLEGWEIGLPLLTGGGAEDMLPLTGSADVELRYRHFSVVMSKSRRMPLLTACNINAAQSRKIPRISTWSFDGRIPKECQWGDELYFGNELDRGHMVRREDPVWGTLEEARQANADTFHFTNSCPQMAGVNQVVWLGLEDHILSHARQDDMNVSVFTGPYFGGNDIPYRGALIPLAFWKVVAIVTDDGRPSATAYKVGQEEELEQLEYVFGRYKTFQISVQSVIDATGLEFSQLVPYDGFSEFERTRGERRRIELETLDQVRI